MQKNTSQKQPGSKAAEERHIPAFLAILIILAVSWFVYITATGLLLYFFPPTPNYTVHTDTFPPDEPFSTAISS